MLDYRKMYYDHIMCRLEDYGFPQGVNPEKYTRYTQVNGVIRLRMKANGFKTPKSGNSIMTKDYYDAAVSFVDRILPGLGEAAKQRIRKGEN